MLGANSRSMRTCGFCEPVHHDPGLHRSELHFGPSQHLAEFFHVDEAMPVIICGGKRNLRGENDNTPVFVGLDVVTRATIGLKSPTSY